MSDEEQRHTEALRQSYTRRLRILEQKAAVQGQNTPPEILIEIEDIRAELAKLQPASGSSPRPTNTPDDRSTPNTMGGDDIKVGDLSEVKGVAIGRGAKLEVHIGTVIVQGPTPIPTPTNRPLAFATEQAGETLIIVAPFYHPNGVPDDDEAHLIKEAIRQQAQSLNVAHLRVEVDDGPPIRAENKDSARVLGERYQASMVIWGSNTRPQLTINYFHLRQPDFDAAQVKLQESGAQGRTQLVNPSAYAGFITNDAPKSMAFLSLFAVGQSAYINEDYARATQIIGKILDQLQDVHLKPPGTADAYFRLGWLYQAPGQEKEVGRAISAYNQALDFDPTDAAAYNNRGTARKNKGDLDGAIADYNQTIALEPKSADAYNNRGTARYTKGDLDGALADFTQAIALNPKLALAYTNRGTARKAKGDLDSALADYNEALDLDPKLALAYTNRGTARKAKGDLDSAIADYTQALTLNPTDAAAYYNRGVARKAKGDFKGAIADFNQAIVLDPTDAAAYSNCGLIYQQRKQSEAAIADFRKARDLYTNPKDRQDAIDRLKELGVNE
ncbi:MAG: tetratricopeptide repeat protein [Roseiflexaceae bacterium]|nr:tetratricopeptide repeat protein [Roseiflexaceae bacterium]